MKAKSDLEAAVPLVSTLKSQIVAQDHAGAAKTLKELKPRVAQAAALTSDPIWRTAETIPGLGPNLTVVRTLAQSSDTLVTGVLQPLMKAADGVSLASLKPVNGKINMAPLTKATPYIARAATTVAAELKTVKSVDGEKTISQVSSARTEFQTILQKASTELTAANSVLGVLPDVLGVHGERNYLIIFENDGELTPGGGTTGSMAILNVNDGAIQLEAQSSASAREFPNFPTSVVPLNSDMNALYPYGLGTHVQDLTETPRFALSYQIAKEMWSQAKGVNINGAISMDTIGLSYLLRATGPISLPVGGLVLNSSNAAQILLGGLHASYTAEQVDAINQAAGAETFSRIASGNVNPAELLKAIEEMGSQHRLVMWSDNAAEQKLIQSSEFNGAPPVPKPGVDNFGVYFMDETPSKLDYYLRQTVDLAQNQCPAATERDVRVTIGLTNTTPSDAAQTLPTYVTGGGAKVPIGDVYTVTYVYAPPGYTVQSTQIDGSAAKAIVAMDGEYTVARNEIIIPPGGKATISVNLVTKDTSKHTLAAQVTPTVSPTTITQSSLPCPAEPTPSATPSAKSTLKAKSKS